MLGEERTWVLGRMLLSGEKGEFVAILGPSGSKTTDEYHRLYGYRGLMNISWTAMRFMKWKRSELNDVRNKEIGFIFQNYQSISTYNILQNIIMPLVV